MPKRKLITKGTTIGYTFYTPIAKNIYYDGNHYRVRISVNGKRHYASFTSKAKAMVYRKEMAAQRV
jgi:hypothetical protein